MKILNHIFQKFSYLKLKLLKEFTNITTMEEIHKILKNLADENDIIILFAVEAGSRAWGFESVDSDYDIRFVYKARDNQKYISLVEPKETIDGFSDDRIYDWQGWDIRKALKLLKTSNPSVLEWLYSPIVYFSDGIFLPECLKLTDTCRLRVPLYHHYRSMAKGNYEKHINGKTSVPAKRYLYVIRPALMAYWILHGPKEEYLKIKFDNVLVDLEEKIGNKCVDTIRNLIDAKRTTIELDPIERYPHLDDLIDSILKLKTIDDIDKDTLKISFDNCNQILFKYILIN